MSGCVSVCVSDVCVCVCVCMSVCFQFWPNLVRGSPSEGIRTKDLEKYNKSIFEPRKKKALISAVGTSTR